MIINEVTTILYKLALVCDSPVKFLPNHTQIYLKWVLGGDTRLENRLFHAELRFVTKKFTCQMHELLLKKILKIHLTQRYKKDNLLGIKF
jgi:hypothetical protein